VQAEQGKQSTASWESKAEQAEQSRAEQGRASRASRAEQSKQSRASKAEQAEQSKQSRASRAEQSRLAAVHPHMSQPVPRQQRKALVDAWVKNVLDLLIPNAIVAVWYAPRHRPVPPGRSFIA
jgi:glutamate/tyrosine decarboxylase-like PLP-dependent enzyme